MRVLRDQRGGPSPVELVEQLPRRLDRRPSRRRQPRPRIHAAGGRLARRARARAPRRPTRSPRGAPALCASAQVGKCTCASLKPGTTHAAAEVDRLGRGERRLVDADPAGDPRRRRSRARARRQLRVERADEAVLEDHERNLERGGRVTRAGSRGRVTAGEPPHGGASPSRAGGRRTKLRRDARSRRRLPRPTWLSSVGARPAQREETARSGDRAADARRGERVSTPSRERPRSIASRSSAAAGSSSPEPTACGVTSSPRIGDRCELRCRVRADRGEGSTRLRDERRSAPRRLGELGAKRCSATSSSGVSCCSRDEQASARVARRRTP